LLIVTSDVKRGKKEKLGYLNGANNNLITRDKLLDSKLIMECNRAKFALFKEGPIFMQLKYMEERLINIESRSIAEFEKELNRGDPIIFIRIKSILKMCS
jgi:hypothetical protein